MFIKVREDTSGEPLAEGLVRVRLDCNDEVIQVGTCEFNQYIYMINI